MAWIDQSLIRMCNKQHQYSEPDEIMLEPAFTEEYKQHFRWVMVRRFKALLDKREEYEMMADSEKAKYEQRY